MPIDPAQLAAWRKLCDAAALFPWKSPGHCDKEDAQFIAAARTALPLLLDKVEALQAEVARLRGKS